MYNSEYFLVSARMHEGKKKDGTICVNDDQLAWLGPDHQYGILQWIDSKDYAFRFESLYDAQMVLREGSYTSPRGLSYVPKTDTFQIIHITTTQTVTENALTFTL